MQILRGVLPYVGAMTLMKSIAKQQYRDVLFLGSPAAICSGFSLTPSTGRVSTKCGPKISPLPFVSYLVFNNVQLMLFVSPTVLVEQENDHLTEYTQKMGGYPTASFRVRADHGLLFGTWGDRHIRYTVT